MFAKPATAKIYIVTPCRNAADTIERTLLSVVTQAGDFYLRYHIQDGGSDDGTLDILLRWQQYLDSGRFPIQCHGVHFSFDSQPDKGMYDAIETAFSQLGAESSVFMSWINADDLLMPGACALVSKVAAGFSDEQISWLGGQTMVMREDMPIVQTDRALPTEVIREGLCDGKYWDFVQQEGTFFRRWLWDSVSPSKNFGTYRLAGDWNLWRLFAERADYVQTPWPLGSFRLRDGQLSRTNFEAYMAEIHATISNENRTSALRRIVEAGNATRKILKAHYPEGSLFIEERPAIDHACHYYQKAFGQFPPRLREIDTQKSARVVCEERQIGERIPAIPDRVATIIPPPHPDSFDRYTYARKSHWKHFAGLDVQLFGESKNPEKEQLKVYQDLLVLRFIRDNVPPGSKILDVGGGDSRILTQLHDIYECWNIDKLEGLGNGPRALKTPPYRLVRDYMGNFNPELPNNYFDFVFSISALEHVPQADTSLFDKILADIDRVLKPGGLSLHLFDIVLKPTSFWTNRFTQHIFENVKTLNRVVTPEQMREDKDFYAMSETAYNNTWFHTVKKPYAEHGLPSSLNILWRKPFQVHGSVPMPLAGLSAHSASPTYWQSRKFYVVTPCLNAVATIDRTIESVLSQSVKVPIHYLIQDGGSTDGTVDRLRYWQTIISESEAYRNVFFSWQSESDTGMYDALLRAFDSMPALPDDFMTWINGDDVLMNDAIESVLRITDVFSDVKWIGGAVRVINEQDQLVEEHELPMPREIIAAGLCDGDHWRHLQQEGMFFRKSLWFMSKHAILGFRLAGDWSLWREFARHTDYYYVRKPLGAFRKRPGQLSVVKHAEYVDEIERCISTSMRKDAMTSLSSLSRNRKLIAHVIKMEASPCTPVLEPCKIDIL